MDIEKIKNNKYVRYSAGFLLLVFLGFEASHRGDFKVFLEAAEAVNAHKNVYALWLSNSCCQYYYSPFFAMLLIPFTYVPYYVVNFLWLSADIYFLYRIWKFVSSKLDFSFFSAKEYRLFIVIAIALSIRFLLYNFDMVQMTIFLLWAMFESLNLFENKKNIQGALLLALVINIKIMPIAMIPYLLLRRKFIPALWVVLFSVAFVCLPAIFLGMEYNNFLLAAWFKAINPTNTEHNIDTYLGTQSLTSWLAPLLMHTGGELTLKRNIANLDVSTVNWIINIARAIFIGATLYFTGLTFFREAKSKLRRLWELSYIMLIIPLVFPHQQKYEFFLSFPGLTYIAYFLIYHYHYQFAYLSKSKWKTCIVLLSISFLLNTLTSDLFIGKHLSDITQHYKSITYGTIVLAVLLAMCNPKYIENNLADTESKK